MDTELLEKENVNFYKVDGYTKEVYIGEFKNTARFINGALQQVDKMQIDSLYIIYSDDDDKFYIIKCPIIDSTNTYYEFLTKYSRNLCGNTAFKYVNDCRYRVKKKQVDSDIYVSSTYNVALTRLLQLEKTKILTKLEETNNPELYKLYIEASQHGLFFGLEYIAKKIGMDYLFRFEDDSNQN